MARPLTCARKIPSYPMADTTPPTKSRSIPRAIALMIVIAALTGAAYVLFVVIPAQQIKVVKNESFDTAQRIADEIDKLMNFRPKVIISGTTVTEPSVNIAELSTVEKTFEHTHSIESTWLGSTKRLQLKGQFIAKAGYDLNNAIQMEIQPDQQIVRVTVPAAKILSVEQTKVEIEVDDNGLWNKITTEQRTQALNALLADAKKSLEETTILSDAQKSFESQLDNILKKHLPPQTKIILEPSP